MRDILLATIPATVPTLAVLVGILLNQNGINRLDARITSLGARFSALEARFHEDILMLVVATLPSQSAWLALKGEIRAKAFFETETNSF